MKTYTCPYCKLTWESEIELRYPRFSLWLISLWCRLHTPRNFWEGWGSKKGHLPYRGMKR